MGAALKSKKKKEAAVGEVKLKQIWDAVIDQLSQEKGSFKEWMIPKVLP